MGSTTERRKQNVRILLQTLNDIYPGPSSVRTDSGTSGPAPGRRVPCGYCHRTGTVYKATERRLSPCPVCDGAKWRPRRPGEPEWDEYTNTLVATSEQPKKAEPMSPERLEAELARVEHSLILSSGEVDPNEAYGWEKAREARDKGASYQELERVLGIMQMEFPEGRSAVNSAYLTDGIGSTLSQDLDDALIGWIADRMRGRIRVPKRFYEEQLAERRERVRAMLRAGVDEVTICKEVGVGRRFVRTETSGTLRVSPGPPACPEVPAPPGGAISSGCPRT